MIPALVDAGHRVTVFANSKETGTFSAEDGRVSVHHFRLPATHWYAAKVPGVRSCFTLPLRQLEWSAAFYRQVARVAARDKIDVLESSETGALFLSRIAPLVIRLHGSEFAFRKHAGLALDLSVRWNDSLEASASQRAVAITAPSQFQAKEIISQRGWPVDRVRVIPNPISATMLKAGLEFERHGGSEPIVLYTGRLAPVKGIETLLGAAKIVHDRNPGITFVLAGPWQMPQPPQYYGLELNRKSADGVRWVGSREQSELTDLYKGASLFVMPSYYESFGISVVEAMAFGLPVVCTQAGALPELVQDRLTGRLVTTGDPEALARGISQSLDHYDESNRMGVAARAHLLSHFTVEHTISATLRVYSYAQGIQDAQLRELERTADAASLGGRV
jgi:glycosyltransferase involved in cell wall biosynthesis